MSFALCVYELFPFDDKLVLKQTIYFSFQNSKVRSKNVWKKFILYVQMSTASRKHNTFWCLQTH